MQKSQNSSQNMYGNYRWPWNETRRSVLFSSFFFPVFRPTARPGNARYAQLIGSTIIPLGLLVLSADDGRIEGKQNGGGSMRSSEGNEEIDFDMSDLKKQCSLIGNGVSLTLRASSKLSDWKRTNRTRTRESLQIHRWKWWEKKRERERERKREKETHIKRSKNVKTLSMLSRGEET